MSVAEKMRAMVLDAPRQPLRCAEVTLPQPQAGQVLLRVHACRVCRTDLHILDGDLAHPKPSLILGHEIAGPMIVWGRRQNDQWA